MTNLNAVNVVSMRSVSEPNQFVHGILGNVKTVIVVDWRALVMFLIAVYQTLFHVQL